MHEPRTFNLFDWEHERLEDWDDPATQWSIDANSRLRPEHMYTMRVLEIWLDVYPSVFQEFPVMLVSDRCKKISSEFEMRPHMKFFSFIALYFIDFILSLNFHRCGQGNFLCMPGKYPTYPTLARKLYTHVQ